MNDLPGNIGPVVFGVGMGWVTIQCPHQYDDLMRNQHRWLAGILIDCIVVDIPGHGRSPFPIEGASERRAGCGNLSLAAARFEYLACPLAGNPAGVGEPHRPDARNDRPATRAGPQTCRW